MQLPRDLHDPEEISAYLWENYHFEIDEDDDYIYYNADLRSRMGLYLLGDGAGEPSDNVIRIVLWPRYYLEGETTETYFGKNWLRLLKNSTIVKED